MTTLIALTHMMESYSHAVALMRELRSVAAVSRRMSLRFLH